MGLPRAMKNGLTKATEFVLTGGSAGGLSTFLHADRVAARLEAEAPDCKLIRAAPVKSYATALPCRCVPFPFGMSPHFAAPRLRRKMQVVGYFLDHGNFKNTTGQPNTPNWHQARRPAALQSRARA